jgi:hypothetical protein
MWEKIARRVIGRSTDSVSPLKVFRRGDAQDNADELNLAVVDVALNNVLSEKEKKRRLIHGAATRIRGRKHGLLLL